MNKHLSKLFSVTLVLALMMSMLSVTQAAQAAPDLFDNPSTTVFINEIHYDNSGTDTGEAVEIAGPAGTDLTGWSLEKYNGNGGFSYGTIPLSGVIPDQQNGFGTLFFAVVGLQNGAPDGIALVDPSSVLVQFLSYEGSFGGTEGPASGMTSTDIGVSEDSGTLVGESLQLMGSGTTYGDFTWVSASANTFGAPNTGQTFGGAPGTPEVIITEIMYDPNSAEDNWEWIEIYNAGTASADLTGYVVDDFNGTAHGSANIAGGTLAAGEQAVLYNADDVSAGDFAAAWGTVNLIPVTNWSAMGLNNGGDQVSLWDSFASYSGDNVTHANAIDTVNYAGAGFPDPVGISIYLTDLSADNNVGSNWGTSTDGGPTPLFTGYASVAAGGNVGGEVGSPGTPVIPLPSLIINEINADPDTALGDANGDGVAQFSDDEFVEIVNNDGTDVDLSGWTLSDGFGVRHTFPSGSVVKASCSVVVFGGGTPTGTFGDSVVQTASTGALGLNNGGDTVTLNNGTDDVASTGYGSEGGDNQSLTRDPDVTGVDPLVKHTLATGSGGALFSPGTKVDGSSFGVCDTVEAPDVFINELRISGSPDAEYFELQGDAGTNLDGLTYVVLSGEFSPGQIDDVIDLTGSSIPADGFFVAANSTAISSYGITPDLSDSLTFFGSPTTHMVVSGFTGSAGDDLDTNNDGTLDITPWTVVVDSVSFIDGDGNPDFSYSTSVVGPDGSFTPAGTYRCDDAPAGSFDNNQLAFASLVGTPGESNASLCVLPVTKIHDVQGAGAASPLVGQTVAIEGIVVGDFQDDVGANGDLNGFFVQEEDADADVNSLTSEGIFVFQGSNPAVNVVIGDHVRVEGPVSEFNGETQITSFSGVTVNSSGNSLPAATVLTLPVSDINDFEAYEGMYVTFPQALVISEYFNYDRFGEIVLTDARHFQPTAVFEPGSDAAANLAVANSLARITLDDGLTSQNPSTTRHPNGDPFSLTNFFRGGDTVTDVTGVINYSFGLYRVQPTAGATYTAVNPRTSSPDPVDGNVSVASFNVLNYFTSLDTIQEPSSGPNDPADDVCGPLADQECRGADDAFEFTRQRAKIIAALAAIDADVVGLMEIENHIGDLPTADLVSGLNDLMGAGTYDYIATGALGSDAIRQAFIYKPANVTPVGAYAVLDTPAFLDPNNTGSDKNRPALAQTFSVNSTGGVFTAVVNHLKSKGSGCGAGDDDPEAGSCNLTRALSAQVLLDWLATDPTNSDDEDFMIIGDLNAYDKEDPIDVLVAGGYTDLAYEFQGEYAYSYVFSGQWGYLDYALTNDALLSKVTGATEWHINADEADLIDYDTTFKSAGQNAIYAPDAYRASDHDPVIVGMELTTEAEIQELIGDVQKLLDDGVLNGGQANALITKLTHALTKLAEGKPGVAANQLDAFINQVEDFVSEGILTANQGDALIKSAQLLVDALSD